MSGGHWLCNDVFAEYYAAKNVEANGENHK